MTIARALWLGLFSFGVLVFASAVYESATGFDWTDVLGLVGGGSCALAGALHSWPGRERESTEDPRS